MFSSLCFRFCITGPGIAMMGIVLAGAVALTSHAGEGEASAVPGLIESGSVIYMQHCAVCHGTTAQGAPNWKRPNDQGDIPPPPHGPEGHTWRHSDSVLKRMIAQGWRDPFNKTQGLTMPGFEQILTAKQIDTMIVYLKSLWTPQQRNFQLQESRVRSAASAQPQRQEP